MGSDDYLPFNEVEFFCHKSRADSRTKNDEIITNQIYEI